MKVKDYLDFDEFRAEMGLSQMGIFSNQAECDAVSQLCSISSVYPTTLRCSPIVALFRRLLHTYICFDIYPETVGVATIEV